MPAASNTAPLFLITGDDDFAVKKRARELFQAWNKETGGFDQEILDGSSANTSEALKAIARLREALQTLPFFGGTKIIWFQNCNFLGEERAASSAAVTGALADLAQELKALDWSNVRLVISGGKADKRKTFYKTIDKIGKTESFTGWSLEDKNWAAEAENYAADFLSKTGKNISDQNLARLVQLIGPNNRLLHNELEKLVLYVGDRADITPKDVDQIVTRTKQSKAFALADSVGNRDLAAVFKNLDAELWEAKFDTSKSEIGLLYGIISKIRVLILLKEMEREGWIKPVNDYNRFKAQLERVPVDALPEDRKFNPLSMHPFTVYNSLGQVKNYTAEELVRAMEILLQGNLQLVSSGLDEAVVLQQALVKIVARPAQQKD